MAETPLATTQDGDYPDALALYSEAIRKYTVNKNVLLGTPLVKDVTAEVDFSEGGKTANFFYFDLLMKDGSAADRLVCRSTSAAPITSRTVSCGSCGSNCTRALSTSSASTARPP